MPVSLLGLCRSSVTWISGTEPAYSLRGVGLVYIFMYF